MSATQALHALRDPTRDPRGPDTVFAASPPEAASVPAAARSQPAAPRSAALPLALGLLAVVAWLGHQAWQLDQERQQLELARSNLQPTVDTAQRLRRSLDLLAADTQRLADGGNANARVLVDELRKRGITINAAASAAASSPGK